MAFAFARTFRGGGTTNSRPLNNEIRQTDSFWSTTMSFEPKPLEASMSYPMIVIGSGVGHLAATIYSAVARGLRALFAQARASEHQQNLVAAPARPRAR
jgi:hypothetical protein